MYLQVAHQHHVAGGVEVVVDAPHVGGADAGARLRPLIACKDVSGLWITDCQLWCHTRDGLELKRQPQ